MHPQSGPLCGPHPDAEDVAEACNPDLPSIVQARVRSAVAALNADIQDYDPAKIRIIRMPRSEINQQTDDTIVPHPEASYQVPTAANFEDYDCDDGEEASGFGGSQTITTESESRLVLRLRPPSADSTAAPTESSTMSHHTLIRKTNRCHKRHQPYNCGELRAKHKVEYFDCGGPGADSLTSESLPEHKGKNCPYCAALRFRSETFAKCCANGKVKLRAVPQAPPFSVELLIGDERVGFHHVNRIPVNAVRDFRRELRLYNSFCSMAPTSVNQKPAPPRGEPAVLLNKR
uniref:Uncharacterized protein n=1 Tax=Ditylenchus dipsaci TaxID=166011 RepID=A0A915CUI4_9BILA